MPERFFEIVDFREVTDSFYKLLVNIYNRSKDDSLGCYFELLVKPSSKDDIIHYINSIGGRYFALQHKAECYGCLGLWHFRDKRKSARMFLSMHPEYSVQDTGLYERALKNCVKWFFNNNVNIDRLLIEFVDGDPRIDIVCKNLQNDIIGKDQIFAHGKMSDTIVIAINRQ